MRNLNGIRVIVAGVGLRPVLTVFRDVVTGEPSHTAVLDEEGNEYKANIGAAAAYECARAGAIVHLVSGNLSYLKIVKQWIENNIKGAQVECSSFNVNNKEEINGWINKLPKDKPLYWVQSVGLGAGSVKIKDDQPCTFIEDSSVEQLDAELTRIKSTLLMMQGLLPIFKSQKETRIVVVTSMASIRSLQNCAVHCGAIGGLSRFVNASMLELEKDNIFITDVRPGIVDTGAYDRNVDIKAWTLAGNGYGYDYNPKTFAALPAGSVGDVICNILTTSSHITSVNMVARGQWPHEGS